jgi:hypothetical protein
MYRALSLDFDGVLHPAGNGEESVEHFVWLPLLEQALQRGPDVGVLVHSTWRYQYSEVEIRALLAPLGKRTISLAPRGPRCEAIRWWLHLNPQVTSHLVLDDAGDEFPMPHGDELVLCRPDLGITTPGVLQRVEAWLLNSLRADHDYGK